MEQHFLVLRKMCVWKEYPTTANLPDNNQHQNPGKNIQQAHVSERHDLLGCPTMDDQGMFGVGPADKHFQRER